MDDFYKKEINELKNNQNEMKKDHDSQIDNLNKKIEKLEKENDNLNKKIDNLEKQNEDLKAEINNMNNIHSQEINKLHSRIDQNDEKLKDLQEKLGLVSKEERNIAINLEKIINQDGQLNKVDSRNLIYSMFEELYFKYNIGDISHTDFVEKFSEKLKEDYFETAPSVLYTLIKIKNNFSTTIHNYQDSLFSIEDFCKFLEQKKYELEINNNEI